MIGLNVFFDYKVYIAVSYVQTLSQAQGKTRTEHTVPRSSPWCVNKMHEPGEVTSVTDAQIKPVDKARCQRVTLLASDFKRSYSKVLANGLLVV